jgi:hypothetical protein
MVFPEHPVPEGPVTVSNNLTMLRIPGGDPELVLLPVQRSPFRQACPSEILSCKAGLFNALQAGWIRRPHRSSLPPAMHHEISMSAGNGLGKAEI